LVTGSGGFVGRSLTSYLRQRGYTVAGLDISGEAEIRADVTRLDELSNSLRGHSFDIVIHLAALANITKCIAEPYECLRINCLGTMNMLELSAAMGAGKFIYASSANVYGARPPLPVTEEAPLRPRSPYDYSKVASENLSLAYRASRGLRVFILRSWKLFGEYDVPTSAVSRFIDACLRDEPITLYNGGRDVTDPYHVDNYCHAVELIIRDRQVDGGVFNIGSGIHLSIRELAEIIRELTGSRSEFRLLPARTPEEAEPMISYPSIERIKSVLGYEPIVPLREGLRRVIEHRRRLLSEE